MQMKSIGNLTAVILMISFVFGLNININDAYARTSLTELQNKIESEEAERIAGDNQLNERIDEQQTQIDDLNTRVEALETYQLQPTRFTPLFDGTVRDNLTNFVWTRNAACPEVIQGNIRYQEAFDFCAQLSNGQCGLTDGSSPGDWQLPSLDQLSSLVDTRFENPALPNADGTDQWEEGDIFWNVRICPMFDGHLIDCNSYSSSTVSGPGEHYGINFTRTYTSPAPGAPIWIFSEPESSPTRVWCIKVESF